MIGAPVNFVDGVTNYIINDRANQPQLWLQSPFYYIKLESVDGHSGSDVSYEAHPIPNATGERSGDVFRRGKTLTLSGQIEALNLGALVAGKEFLQQMFQSTALRHLRFYDFGDGNQRYYICRVNQDLAVVETAPNPNENAYRWPWTVGLRADDPRTRKVSDNSIYPTWQT